MVMVLVSDSQWVAYPVTYAIVGDRFIGSEVQLLKDCEFTIDATLWLKNNVT